MFKRFISLGALAAALFLTGCATQKQMALSENPSSPVATDKAVYLMTATIKNSYKTSYQPKMIVTHIEKDAASSSSDRINFKPDSIGTLTANAEDGATYLIRMELENGNYVVRGMSCHAMSFPINGFYFAPVHSEFAVKGPGVFYLGHVNATVRERQGDEFKAGASIPLIDQALAGASTGTFDVQISDRWSKDESLFKTTFPGLTNASVQKSVLPAFDRQKAQDWWQAH